MNACNNNLTVFMPALDGYFAIMPYLCTII